MCNKERHGYAEGLGPSSRIRARITNFRVCLLLA